MKSAAEPRLLNVPNQLTIARLLLSLVFFVLLGLVGHGSITGSERAALLNLSTALFVLAVLTDFLDGYLARRWRIESTFGRIADPFVDKIVICGGFIMLTGVSQPGRADLVEPWYAVLIMFREFLVSGLRSFLESKGVAFGAATSGKLKMTLQSITIPAVLLYEANFAPSASLGGSFLGAAEPSIRLLTVLLLGATLIFTIGSCVGYVQRAVKILRD